MTIEAQATTELLTLRRTLDRLVDERRTQELTRSGEREYRTLCDRERTLILAAPITHSVA